MSHNLSENNPLIQPSDIRIVGINDTDFIVTHNMSLNRLNIKIISKQFKKLTELLKLTDPYEIRNLYNRRKNNLTDIIIEEKGYY
jgi:predicted RNA-binding protein with PUA domain